MELRCEGCAGCCVDWRSVAPEAAGRDRVSDRPPLDTTYGLAPLTRDEVVGFLDDGLGDALTPRLFEPTDRDAVIPVDGVDVAAVGDHPVFMIGLRKPPKPVAPIGTDEPRWLDACVFLDPTTLQCRIHGDDRYPRTCSTYPGHNLILGAETECERVEDAGGGDRLLDAEAPTDLPPPAFGPQALGATVFAYPEPDALDGFVGRLRNDSLTADDRARFVGAAVGSRPGSLSVDRERMAEARSRAREADSWAGRAVREWTERADEDGTALDGDVDARDRLTRELEVDAGAPETPGWD